MRASSEAADPGRWLCFLAGWSGPIRILYSFSSRLGTTGVGQTAANQILALHRRGVRLTVVAPSCEITLPRDVELCETMRFGPWRAPVRRLRSFDPRIWHDFSVARIVASRVRAYDALHCWPATSRVTLKAARQFGLKSFLERPNCHTRYAMEVVGREFQRLGLTQPRGHPHTFDARRLRPQEVEYQRVDFLLCPSEFVARSFERFGFPASRLIREHQYGCDLSRFRAGPMPTPSPLRLLFVGRCEVRKGLHYALEAWRDSGAAELGGEFHICGAFDPDYRAYLAPLLLSPGVHYHGFIDRVEDLMGKFHALVLSSIEEGSALVTYEARASGCVLLVSEAAGARCKHGHDALVHRVGDVAALRDHIRRLASDPDLISSLRSASLASVTELGWDAAAEKLVRAYAS